MFSRTDNAVVDAEQQSRHSTESADPVADEGFGYASQGNFRVFRQGDWSEGTNHPLLYLSQTDGLCARSERLRDNIRSLMSKFRSLVIRSIRELLTSSSQELELTV